MDDICIVLWYNVNMGDECKDTGPIREGRLKRRIEYIKKISGVRVIFY